MIGIYKITNLTNNKSYIGQSVHIERRWSEHCQPSATSVIGKAIQEYGKTNFSFEVLEQFEDINHQILDQREKFYIDFYNTIAPYGYNITDYIDNSHQTSYGVIDKEKLSIIIEEIQNSDLSFVDIAQKHNLNRRTIIRINQGETHKINGLIYPLRDNTIKKTQNYCKDCGKEIHSKSQRCDKCHRLSTRSQERPPRERLKEQIRTMPMTKVAQLYNMSDNGIRKWCDSYGLPRKSTDIKKYSDDEWNLI